MNIATLTMFNVQYKPFALLIPGGIQLATWQIPHPGKDSSSKCAWPQGSERSSWTGVRNRCAFAFSIKCLAHLCLKRNGTRMCSLAVECSERKESSAGLPSNHYHRALEQEKKAASWSNVATECRTSTKKSRMTAWWSLTTLKKDGRTGFHLARTKLELAVLRYELKKKVGGK